MQVEELIAGCKAGSRKHFAELYESYAAAMYGICLRYSGSTEEAEDILQDGFINVFVQIKSFDSARGSFERWMRSIFINRAIDYLRSREHFLNSLPPETADEEWDEEDEVYQEPDIDLSQAELLQMIRELPAGYRAVFNLHVMEEKNHKAIAEMLGISESTSKTQLMKARRMLQEKIAQRTGVDLAAIMKKRRVG